MTISLGVQASSDSDEPGAVVLATGLRLPLVETGVRVQAVEHYDALLVLQGTQLLLQQCGHNVPGPVSVDFGSGAMRHRRRAGANELLGKAVGVGKKTPLRVLDATAGLARDSFVLADLGCEVAMYERHPVVGQLLSAGLRTAAESADSWQRAVVKRMQLHLLDPRQAQSHWSGSANDMTDVIYLDPMFAARSKSAAVKKDLALLQALMSSTSDQQDAEDLLQWALQQDVARVVIKRPAKGSQLAGLSPSHSIRGKAVRYDVHVLRKL